METVRRTESDWQWRAWSGVAGAEGGGEHVPDFGGVHEHRFEAIGCIDGGFRDVIFDIRLPKAPRKNWEISDNGFLTSCYSPANSGAVDASELPPHETASETLR